MTIREAGESDLDAVLRVEREAFGRDSEAQLVDDLLKDPTARPYLSLLAFENDRAGGHILFTPVRISGFPETSATILAPLAVIPSHQHRQCSRTAGGTPVGILRNPRTRRWLTPAHRASPSRSGSAPVASAGAIEDDCARKVSRIPGIRPATATGAAGEAGGAVGSSKLSPGIGTALGKEGLRRLSESGVSLVFVLGHPEYYPRFGFRPAGALGFQAPYPIQEKHKDAWMVLALQRGAIGRASGQIVCANALMKPEYWRE